MSNLDNEYMDRLCNLATVALHKNSIIGEACLEFFRLANTLPKLTAEQQYQIFQTAFQEDPLTALKILFYIRDARGGLGQRRVFRNILKQAAHEYTREIRINIPNIHEYGRWDDLYVLIDTPCESAMWYHMENQLKRDLENMYKGEPVSLLAKWVKRGDESSTKSHALGILTANRLGYSVYQFKRIIAKLRRYLDVVEVKMSTQRWDEIDYAKVPNRAAKLYRDAFIRHGVATPEEPGADSSASNMLPRESATANDSNIRTIDLRQLVYCIWSDRYQQVKVPSDSELLTK